ncbi:Putative transposase [Roseimaritima multifibrata]|uniref:Transposase n=1 Tax=Roseimaritima multifibrata TaxID=1930274 RepID=A0A517MFD5_9BACT|nr:transposase [Roseimaritima multifibrata]QDS93556.1 Putative transposase [Roseimaritima multifibrata]
MAVTLQSIFQQHFDAFAERHRLSRDMFRAAWAVRHCRTRELGGHVNSCPDGHFHQIAYNSCRHRSCPQCGWLPKEQWLAGWRTRLLPCPHHHIIFTVPHSLNDLWRFNKAAFADTLFAAASQTLSELLGDVKFLGGRVGVLAALHTWNQELKSHVHLHTIVTAGGLDGDGQWRKPVKKCLLPRKVLMIKFRGKFKAMLREKLRQGRMKLPPGMTGDAFERLLRELTAVPWNVKVFDAYRNGVSVATYLARYIKGGPIGNSRLLSLKNGRVVFRYRLPHRRGGDGKRQAKMDLPVDTFIGRWLQHVPPRRFQTVRGYGLYCGNQHSRWECAAETLGVRVDVNAGDDLSVEEIRDWQDWCEAAGMSDVCRCPKCNKRLVSHHEFASGRGPPVGALPYRQSVKQGNVAGGMIA